MKKIFIILIACMAVTAGFGKGDKYVLIAEDPEFVNGRYAYLGVEDMCTGKPETVDSVLIADNTVRFEGRIGTPTVAYVMTSTAAGTDLPDGRKLVQDTAILEAGTIVLCRMAGSLYPEAGSTPLNDLLVSFLTATAQTREKLEEAETDDDFTKLMNEYFIYAENIIHKNRGNALGAYLLDLMSAEMPPAAVLRLISEFPGCEERFSETKAIAQTAVTVTAGNEYIDIIGAGPEGTEIALSDVVENRDCRYVLVDFWASWCGPCMQQLKALRKLYGNYHGRGFEIYAVSSDFSREAWLEAIGTNRMGWVNIMADGGMESPAYEKYAVCAIPSNFLIDCATGKIAAANLPVTALERKLQEFEKNRK